MKVASLAAALALLIGGTCVAQVDEPALRVEKVECRGNRSTSCEFIRSHLNLGAGMPVDEGEIRNAQLRLSSLRNFELVELRLERGTQRNAIIVVIDVVESSPVTTELLAGLSSRLDTTRSVLAGRVAHQNLSGAGKTLDIVGVAVAPLAGDAHDEDYELHVRYADPNLFGSADYFGIARASWINARSSDIHGNYSDFEGAELDLRIGRRFGDFSYLTLGVTYRPNPDWIIGQWDGGGTFDVTVKDGRRGLNIIYGRNSEDDLYFPTRGYSFHVGAGWDFGSGSPANRSHVQFRRTWQLDEGFLTLKLGGAPSPEYRTSFEENLLLSLSYAREVTVSDTMKRGRWYIEPGVGTDDYHTPEGERIYEVGIKAGVRLHTTAFGIVDLYLMGSVDPQR